MLGLRVGERQPAVSPPSPLSGDAQPDDAAKDDGGAEAGEEAGGLAEDGHVDRVHPRNLGQLKERRYARTRAPARLS